MSLTPAQLVTLKTAIDADPVLAAIPNNNDGAYEIAQALNQPAVPDFYVWRSQYTRDLLRKAIGNGITQLDGLTASKRDSLLWWAGADQDFSTTAARAAADDLTGSQNTLKAAIIDGGKRLASRVEKILATGTGSFASPAVAGYNGTVSYQDVMLARAA